MPAIPHDAPPCPRSSATAQAHRLDGPVASPAASTEARTDDAHARIRLLGQRLTALGVALATAESCTGGLIAARCTDVPGSSAWFTGGVVAYANDVKRDVLGVDPALLAAHGAVSEPVVRAMAAGVRRLTGARFAVAVSGVAGPDGGTPEKPVGTVWMAVADGENVQALRFLFCGDRAAVRNAAVDAAVEALLALCDGQAMPGGGNAP
ncbi:CinA family protein [Nitratidesulfovibrio sp. 1201_IL3209]|uniref:CinA family protein n=1 Tax=Nitratidesulfovibrio sp. 1201_IL3209 TaxID=3084053 RepID=UPI002FDA5D45